MFFCFSVQYPEYERRMQAITLHALWHFLDDSSQINQWELV